MQRTFFSALFSALLVVFVLVSGNAQAKEVKHIMDDPARMELIKQTVKHIYSWEFTLAEAKHKQFSAGIEEHPAVPFAEAMIYYWKGMPLEFGSANYKKHEELLIKASDLAEAMLDEDDEDVEGVFFKMAARSLLMKHYADQGQSMKAISEAKGVYKLLKMGFDLKDEMIEFYFTTGAYNYYREYYPERYPVYKPFMFFFQSGSKTLGLEQLEYTARNATFTSAEAYAYLTYINLRYEKNNDKAVGFAREIANKYPRNLYFQSSYAEALILTKRYDEVAKITPKLIASSTPYYKSLGHLFDGMVAELKAKDMKKAFTSYRLSQDIIGKSSLHEYCVYLYYGLANCYKSQGNEAKYKEYYKYAKDCDVNGYLKENGQ